MRLGLGLGLNRITSVLGRIPGYSALVQWFKGTATDGILQDRIGKFPATERYAGKKWDGDGNAYVDCGSFFDGTKQRMHLYVKFNTPAPVGIETIFGQELAIKVQARATQFFVFISENGTSWKYTTNVFSAITYGQENTITYDSDTGILEVNGATFGTYAISQIPSNARKLAIAAKDDATEAYNGEIIDCSINGHTFPFEMEASSDLMNSIPPTGEEPITGTIINNDGARIVADDSVEQYFNVRGGAISDGATYYYDNGGLNLVPIGNVGIKTDDGDLNFYLANGDRASVVYHGPVGNDLTECDIAGTPTIGGDYLKAPVDPAIYRVSNATINNITNEWYDDTDPTALTALIVAKSSLTGLKNDSNQQFTRGTGTTIDELATFNAPQTGNTLTRILAYFGL